MLPTRRAILFAALATAALAPASTRRRAQRPGRHVRPGRQGLAVHGRSGRCRGSSPREARRRRHDPRERHRRLARQRGWDARPQLRRRRCRGRRVPRRIPALLRRPPGRRQDRRQRPDERRHRDRDRAPALAAGEARRGFDPERRRRRQGDPAGRRGRATTTAACFRSPTVACFSPATARPARRRTSRCWS